MEGLIGPYGLDCVYIALASGRQPAGYKQWTPLAFRAPPRNEVENHMGHPCGDPHVDPLFLFPQGGVISLEKVCTSIRNPHGRATHVDHHMAIHMPRSTKGFNAMHRSLQSESSGKAP